MVFSSIPFIYYFLPAFFSLYFFLPKKWRNEVALAGSMFFYFWGSPTFFWILLGSAVVDFSMMKYGLQEGKDKQNRLILTIGVLFNAGLLIYFKYANFFVESTNELLTAFQGNEISWEKVALPIGISFVTFQKISFFIDVYRDKKKLEPSFTNYLLFVFLFPQLIAGPIVRFKEISTQFIHRAFSDYKSKLEGVNRFCFGLGKKVLIADMFAPIADQAFTTTDLSTPDAWIGMFAYYFQIYFDFSGYSDMAIGLGKIMGFKIPENFNYPYISRSIQEFWRRWHITLSTWMKDYIYIPLGGNRTSTGRTYVNLSIVFLFSGIWHGANWTFLLFGAYHGFFMILEQLGLKKVYERIGFFAAILSQLIVLFGWLTFRCNSVIEISHYVASCFAFEGTLTYEVTPRLVIAGAIGLITLFGTPSGIRNLLDKTFTFNSNTKASIVSLLSLLILIYASGEIAATNFQPFIYFKF